MEPPLCSSPPHLSGLTVARLRLAQLVSFAKKKNIIETPYNTNGRPAPPHWLSQVRMWCRCREPPTPPLTVVFCLTLRPRSSSPSSPRTSSSTPSLTETSLLVGRVAELKNYPSRLEHIPPPFLIRWLGVVHLLTWRQNQERWRCTLTTHWREPRPRYSRMS